MNYEVIQVDAFASKPLEGNPCAVLPDARGLDDALMQRIAREMNLSETAYVFPGERTDFRVRYFTPYSEIPMAGIRRSRPCTRFARSVSSVQIEPASRSRCRPG